MSDHVEDKVDVADEMSYSRRGLLARGLTSGAAASVALAGGRIPSAFGATDTRSATQYTIGIGLPFRTSIVYNPLLKGFEQGAKETGATFLQSSSADNLQSQLSDLNSWIARPVNAITMFPLSPNSLGPIVKKAHAKGIKVVGYAVHVPGEDGYVIFNNQGGSKAIGVEAAKWLTKNKGGAGKIAVLDDTTPVARQRLDPAIAVLKKMVPNSTIVARPKVDPPIESNAYTAAQSILQANPDVSLFLCVDDDEALGVHQAVKAAGHKPTDIWIAGMDGSLQNMQLLLSGQMIGASGALPLKEIGRQAVHVPVNILTGKGPHHYIAQYLIVTHETPALAQRLIKDYAK
jgi:ABC-type sugar transport system substrate-binding protein